MNARTYNHIISELTPEQFTSVDKAVMELWNNNGEYTDDMLKAIAFKLLIALGES
jgi:hypothetical protein